MQMSSAMAQPPPKDPNNYVPGLGDLMGSLQLQHGKLWFAGSAQNWPLAAYAVDSIKEGIADMIVLRPRYKRESIVEMLALFTAKHCRIFKKQLKQRTVRYLRRLMIRLPKAATPATTITTMGLSLFSDRRFPPGPICATGPKLGQNPNGGAT